MPLAFTQDFLVLWFYVLSKSFRVNTSIKEGKINIKILFPSNIGLLKTSFPRLVWQPGGELCSIAM